MNQIYAHSIAPLRRRMVALILVVGVLFAPLPALAGGSLDQSPSSTDGFFNADTSGFIWQQQIKAGIAGQLVQIAIDISGPAAGTLNLRIRRGAAPSTQPILFQQVVTNAGLHTVVDTSAAPLSFAVGDLFVMEIQGTDTGLTIAGGLSAPPQPPLYSEPLFLNGAAYGAGYALGFSTYVGPCTVNAQCDDQNLCTTESCNVATGLCAAGPVVVCAALDGCHAAGACDPASGVCSTPIKADGSACSDGNSCTESDTCESGVCVAGAKVVCKALDGCHVAGTCNPMVGCTNPEKYDCSTQSVCEKAGACDPVIGACTTSALPDGIPCGAGQCLAGICTDPAGNTTSVTSASATGSTGVGGAGSGGSGVSGSGAGGADGTTSATGATGATGVGGSSSTSVASGAGGTSPSGGDGSVIVAGGCGCTTAGDAGAQAPWLLLGLLLPVWRRKRQASRHAG